MAHRALDDGEVAGQLADLNGRDAAPWTVENGKLHKEFQFRDFIEAFGFMSQAALVAERADHHPEWFNVYRTVRVDLMTHDVKGISERDFALARAMNAIAKRA